MENLVTNAKKFLDTDEGKKIANAAGFGDNNNNDNDSNNKGGSTDAFGNAGQEGQYGQPGQYGAVTGQGFGGGLAKGADGQNLQQQQQQRQGGGGASVDAQGNQGQPGQYGSEGQWGAVRGKGLGGAVDPTQHSNYEGWDGKDSTTSGGWGGDSFSRRAQMGADDAGREPVADDIEEGYKTGTSTPGYRHPDDVDALAAENRVKNQNVNVYGQQSDERGSKDDDRHEQI